MRGEYDDEQLSNGDNYKADTDDETVSIDEYNVENNVDNSDVNIELHHVVNYNDNNINTDNFDENTNDVMHSICLDAAHVLQYPSTGIHQLLNY